MAEYTLSSFSESWIASLILNLLCYATVFVPGYLLIRYFKKSKYIERAGSGLFSRVVTSCVFGQSYDKLATTDPAHSRPTPPEKSFSSKCLQLSFCFLGLQVSYLTWGVLQEKIMTKEYQNSEGSIGHFKDSQFLVFVNRILAFLLAAVYLTCTRQPRHTAPIYKYSYCSFSNIMSSWCQYEALKYVTFPTQVLAKASKIIPTMIMGKIIASKKYEYYEYVTALLISFGMTMFLLGSTEAHGTSSSTTTLSGVIILVGYMSFDAFTSNWQGELFNQHKMSSVQMMCGVNLFSCLFTTTSLMQQGTFSVSLQFMLTYPGFFWDSLILSVCSATGQLFIYYTISVFGPVVFIIIMTIRQGLAILLSCIIYSHPVTLMGLLGILLVFTAIFLRLYCSYRLKQVQQRRAMSDTTKV
ncbi:adenosine 3'-phospho 5'-phosphosulfate transporter 1-like isoform X2 [Eriocheir sinensis]|nr:adenosine 3'-phospho 5'-phosphosulfate transporter 1-like isoform X2 [Eriocheir sinensis]XP_050715602.1 adenosine 3'-phospho 5'-phosphosulfate transporter 1-like isoform X2 [Eriocheir sinensis]XP_050715603.1 adenosine 3'-phospho 5'-phosphosulfate transporter 1-like isoform X2 [Eriocheir sinensis]XP_050715604.1 adenosine 3'-phospho 5'-phosphosulfate transporter 1-like isoform X2 [Eriocheir sinensis]XP_050715605.1 adenosine 3'-phospho 5'-phosphosulfate transporter 1-like isoform X2 [Eriocheir 